MASVTITFSHSTYLLMLQILEDAYEHRHRDLDLMSEEEREREQKIIDRYEALGERLSQISPARKVTRVDLSDV